MTYTPPYKITPLILTLSQNIFRELGALSGAKLDIVPVKLRRANTIKTIYASLAIEGNTLGIDQITHLFEGKRVIGPKEDIIEVNNAIEVYSLLSKWDPLSINDCLKAHEFLMKNLVSDNGKWREKGVGVFKAGKISHMAPPAKRVPLLMSDLFNFIANIPQISWLLKACIFHYEFEFIHPFSDGNGRMGRLWQQLLLMKEDCVFQYISIETLIREHQTTYYEVLEQCDQAGDSTAFIEFSLDKIWIALTGYRKTTSPIVQDPRTRLQFAREKLGNAWFSRHHYLLINSDIATATASRDLHQGLEDGILQRKGEKNQMMYKFVEM